MESGRWCLAGVSDDVLEARLFELLGNGARTEAWVVAHLAEIEKRGLYLRLGYESMFEYCLDCLRLGDFEAFLRLTAARVAQRYPVALELLEQQKLHLTAIRLLRDYLTAENHAELLALAVHKSKRQIVALLAERFPQADAPEVLRRLPQLVPLAPGRYRLQVTLGAAATAKLELARDLLSHANPTGDFATVIERGMDVLLEQLNRRRFGGLSPKASKLQSVATSSVGPDRDQGPTERSGPHSSPSGSKRVGRAVRRAVVERDGLRCSFVGRDGRRCGARAFLQFDHIEPTALGGPSTTDNVRLLCGAHNRLLSSDLFGPALGRVNPR